MPNLIRLISAAVIAGWLIVAVTMLWPTPSSNQQVAGESDDALKRVVAEHLAKKGIDPTPDNIERSVSDMFAKAKARNWLIWSCVLVVVLVGLLSGFGSMKNWRKWRWPLAMTAGLYIAWLVINVVASGVSPTDFYAISFDAAYRSGMRAQVASYAQLIVIPSVFLISISVAILNGRHAGFTPEDN